MGPRDCRAPLFSLWLWLWLWLCLCLCLRGSHNLSEHDLHLVATACAGAAEPAQPRPCAGSIVGHHTHHCARALSPSARSPSGPSPSSRCASKTAVPRGLIPSGHSPGCW